MAHSRTSTVELAGRVEITLTGDELHTIRAALYSDQRRAREARDRGDTLGLRFGRLDKLLRELPVVLS